MATLMATAFGATVAAGATAATATAGAAAAAGTLATLQTASTVIGGLAAIFAGFSKASSLKEQASQEDFAADQELLKGREDALKAMKQLNKEMAQSAVASFASGLAPSGSVLEAQKEAIKTGTRNVDTSRTNASIASLGRRRQANQLRSDATAAAIGGISSALAGGLQSISRGYGRG